MLLLFYYEKEKNCIVELPEYLDEWTAPLLFTSYVKRKIYTIPRGISSLWVKERVIPSGRQNIKDILAQHHLQSYDEMKFLEISEGRCSQDNLYIKKIDELPDFVIKRQQKNILDTTESCSMLECSRQNISYMVSQGQLAPVKEEVRGNLYLKGDVLRTMW